MAVWAPPHTTIVAAMLLLPAAYAGTFARKPNYMYDAPVLERILQ